MSLQDQNYQKTSHRNDFLSRYHIISNKLKKRFLRKPNVSEASEQFEALAVSFEQKELDQYAGWCWLAAARCQATLENQISEINLLARAGCQFIIANKKNKDIGCLSINKEDLQAAINALNHALTRCNNQQGFEVLSSGLAMKLSMNLGANSEGIEYIRKAAHSNPSVQAINILVSYYIKQGDYVSALQVLTELVEMIENHLGSRAISNYKNVLHKCEISRVLLLLILQPTPQRLAPSLVQLLEKYAWAEDSPVPNMMEDEMLLLQSLVLACQSHDYEALLALESELWPFFDSEQKELLQSLVQTFSKA
ncbi:40-kDa huntingtin-associated protein [Nasonia vitripennis]|uniref:Factor VIII intron 22 protein n=1 Tax=Nasonia vitripennis TaxID=7425 RepID=A0A7M7IUG3_NASVI|nr:40-kDa huntingtin-associated protein [Nasonia vitripennis]XP_008212118.1 40-kDa huntingtin-associated protein [Nasonia vitripennis]XP_008212124.1 40-kDa huntingtin-associated protein [Nasonia vitripennis]XP_008212125.1 40-kDa huntingtin-associated protein [Nasonia vitripennis]XP_008212126.1 40-kDa huntingtin-associated protein [Nasonia vitripennis]XP_008212127.1 40-kDa huntingtin-associated protein [Nasonia vitripennis]XP_016844284.1 40-kDa huntingtin-associated protein [Nasonia vitripenni